MTIGPKWLRAQSSWVGKPYLVFNRTVNILPTQDAARSLDPGYSVPGQPSATWTGHSGQAASPPRGSTSSPRTTRACWPSASVLAENGRDWFGLDPSASLFIRSSERNVPFIIPGSLDTIVTTWRWIKGTICAGIWKLCRIARKLTLAVELYEGRLW